MKPKPPPLRSPQGGSVLDWPAEWGDLDRFLAAVAVRRRRKRRRRRIAGGLAGGVTLILSLWAIPLLRQTGAVETGAARRQTLALTDGSRAELNAQTRLQTDFRYGRRTVRLERGEAFFTVARDARRPFLVHTPAGTIRVTGTQFDVRLGPDGETEVTLKEGSILFLRSGQPPVRLSPGEQFDSARRGLHRLSSAEVESVEAWRSGLLDCDGLSLAEVAERLSAYHGRRITVSPDIARLKLGGSFQIDDLSAALQVVEAAVDVAVVADPDGSYRIAAK